MPVLRRLGRSRVVIAAVAGSPTPWRDGWLAVRMLAWALVLPVLEHVVPLPSLVRLMWRDSRPVPRNRERERLVASLASWFSQGTNLSSAGACLPRSLLAYRFLSELHANPRLMIAFKKTETALAGHAWVAVDGQAIGEPSDALTDFLPVVAFGERGARVVA